MEFPYGQTVVRERRKEVPDRYDPAKTRPGSWSDELDALPIEDAFVASSSSVGTATESRNQVLTSKSLYCTDPDVDVRVGDRIQVTGYLEPFYVNARPEADMNPFTGWRPAVEIPLDLTEG